MIEELTKGTLITGASDDLIELRGDLYEEFYAFDCENGVVAFSDGTLLNAKYDEDGIWRFNLISKGNLFSKIEQGIVDEDTDDTVYFDEGLKWCVFSGKMQSVIRK